MLAPGLSPKNFQLEIQLPAPVSLASSHLHEMEGAKPLSPKEIEDLAARSTSENVEERKKAIQEVEKLPLESTVRLFEHFRDKKLVGKPSSDDAVNALTKSLRRPHAEIGEMILNLQDGKFKKEDIRLLGVIAEGGFGISTEPQKSRNQLFADSEKTNVGQVESFRDVIADSIKLAAPGTKAQNEFVEGSRTDTTKLTLKDGREVILGVERGGFFPGLQLFDVRVISKTSDTSVTVIGTFKDKE